ncbi:MAG: ubiquinone/menaquinone biosynthesis methyltransferase [Propionibacteriaceae bacterium]|nr:ubiquinone/menaquinone biosynthesis methyltransferase [Propionibacteriaceae bacterium]
MFSAVAPRYDLVNDLASLGQDRRWRAAVADALKPQPGELILDVAAGTGASSAAIAQSGASVVSTDLTAGMVAVGHRRHPDQVFVVGDATNLPYADGVFDAATSSFGLRNVCDPSQALSELLRVVRSGGTLVICEFSTPTSKLMRWLNYRWLSIALPIVSTIASSNAVAYSYLSDSILEWPDQHGLAVMLEETGWKDIQWRNLTGGIVAMHRAIRP